jgi:hypothetical protein
MTYDVEFYDPRHDPEPGFWEPWRRAAGLWANWGWAPMRAGSWHSRDPLLVAVLRRRGGPHGSTESGQAHVAGVVCAAVRGAVPRARFCPARRFPRAGYLHVIAPQNAAQAGWHLDTDSPGERAAMFRVYVRAARRRLGPAVAAVLWRQVGADDVKALPHRMLVRPTWPFCSIDTPFRDRAEWLATLRKGRRRELQRLARVLERDEDLVVTGGLGRGVVTPAEVTRVARFNFDRYPTARADRSTGLRAYAWNKALLDRDDVGAIAYRDRGGRLLGVGLILEHPTRPYLMSWGAEPIGDGGRPHLYFDLYCRMIDRATAAGAEAVMLGKGVADIKADLGAQVSPQFAVAARTF